MPSANLTKHAAERFDQRGFRCNDADLIMHIGTEVDDGFLVRDKDVAAYIRELRAKMKRAERLAGARVVVANGAVITGYRASKRKQNQLLRVSN